MGGRSEQGEFARFECKARSEGYASLQFISTMIALGGMVASQLKENPTYAVLLFALIIAAAAVASVLRPMAKSVCSLSEEGIEIASASGRGRSRLLRWREISRFSWSSAGMKGGRIYIYPKGFFSVLRREVVETMTLFDFNLLFNALASRTVIPLA